LKKIVAVILLLSLLTGGCVYYNTFYNAKKFYNDAESSREKGKRDTARGTELTNYQNAIKKCSKVLSEFPGSKYEDDALFMIGKSFYYLGEFQKAERKFRELLSNYPDSKFATESRFFLGKSRLKLENYVLAAESFKQFLTEKAKPKWRAEALYYMGELYYDQEKYSDAVEYYTDFVNQHSSDYRVPDVEFKLGDIYSHLENYDSSVAAYAKAAEKLEDANSKFDALYQEAIALYYLDSLDAGLALLNGMIDDPMYTKHMGNVRLRIAEGHYLQGDYEKAIREFDEITSDFPRTAAEAEAYYNMGVIIQNEFDDLETAKEMFDWASRVTNGGEFRQLSIEKSANIAKAEEYRQNVKSDELDEVIQSQYLLAELYRLTLNKPDSALAEYRSLVEEYPGADLAPRALLAMGWVYENQLGDTAQAEAAYKRVLDEYPYSDEYGDALELLGLNGSVYDTLYSEKLYHMAEAQYVDYNDPDSALVLFRLLKSRFRDSHLIPKADLAIARIELQEFKPQPAPPGDSTFVDSTMIHVFHELGTKYAGTKVGEEASRVAAGELEEKAKPNLPPRNQQQRQEPGIERDTSGALADQGSMGEGDDTLTAGQREDLRIKQILEEVPLAPDKPTVEPEFQYPLSAYGDPFEGKIMTKIKIEFDGKVTEVELLKPSGKEDIDNEVKRVLLLTEFNPMEIEPLNIGGYFIYYYQVTPPESIRRRD
jgi:TonB family protein